MRRNSLKVRALSRSSSTSLIIAFNPIWVWGAPNFSIINYTNSSQLWQLILILSNTFSSVSPIIWVSYEQNSLNFFSKSLICFLVNSVNSMYTFLLTLSFCWGASTPWLTASLCCSFANSSLVGSPISRDGQILVS